MTTQPLAIRAIPASQAPAPPPPPQPPLPVLVPLSDEEEEEANKLFLDKYYDDYTGIRDYFDDAISGFWKTWKPEQRLALYERNEPVFSDDTMAIEMWLQQAYMGNPDVGLLLAPYWQELYLYRPLECKRMLSDYATILKGRERRRRGNGYG